MYDVNQIKAAADGQWEMLLPTITGIDPNLLDGKGHPCPNPQCPNGPGRDRFSARDLHRGSLFCRYCNSSGTTTMDGLGAIQWLTGMTFPEAIEAVANVLGIGESQSTQPKRTLLEAVAVSKGVTVDALLAYGAHNATRKDEETDHAVIRFPTFAEYADGQLVPGGAFDLGMDTPRLRKGKSAYGRPPGIFLPSVQRNGERVIWKPAKGRRVFLTEGVKDAAKLLELGYPAIGLPGTRLPAPLVPVFSGMQVYLIPDRDRGGIRGAMETAALLHGHAAEVRIVHLPSPVKPSDGDGVREVTRRKDGPKDLKAAIDTAVKWTPEAMQQQAFISLPDAAIKWLERQERGDTIVYRTGVEPLDAALKGGMEQGELIIIGARPSHGKSAIALSICEAHALQGNQSLFVSEEMEPEMLGKRWLSSVLGRSPNKSDDPRQLIDKIRNEHALMNGIQIISKLQQVDKVIEAMEVAKQLHGCSLCVVDYAQILDSSGKRNEYEKITDVSKQLALAAKRTGLTTIVLCQLSRECEKRGYPLSVDLKQSGQFEQDADVILLLWYPCMVGDEDDKPRDKQTGAIDRNEFQVHVVKNRNRGLPPNRVVKLDFFADRMRFADPAHRMALEYAEEITPNMSFEEEAMRG